MENPELVQIEKKVLNLNRQAMNQLAEEKFGQSIKVLKEAETILASFEDSQKIGKLLAITLNNYGCIYKRMRRPITALKYLKQASEYEKLEPIDRINLAGTYLNICAIYSDLSKHDLALDEARKALALLENRKATTENHITTLVIAYHNAGVQYEFMGNIKGAVDCYKAAFETSLDNLGLKHPLTQSMNKSYQDANSKSMNETARLSARQEYRENSKLPVKLRVENKGLNTTLPSSRLPKLSNHERRRKSQPSKDINPLHSRNLTMDLTRLKSATKPLNSLDISNVRFLTGDRLQPMFNHDSNKPAFLNTTITSNVPPKTALNRTENKETAKRVATAPAQQQKRPMKDALRNIGDHIERLQNKLDDFNNLVKPLRDINEENRTDSTFSRYSIDNLIFQRISSAIKIQAWYRGWKVRRQSEFRIKSKRIVKIANQKRAQKGQLSPIFVNEITGFDIINNKHDQTSKIEESKKSLSPTDKAAIIIQKHARRFVCRNIFKNILEAIVFIQSTFRGHRVRKNLRQLH